MASTDNVKGLPQAPSFAHFKNICVCCEQSGKQMNKEHFYPQWLLKRTKTQKDLFSTPYGKIPADQFTVPLCMECNSLLGRELELPVSIIFDSIESGHGFNDYEAELLIRWMWKLNGIFYWSICNENWRYGLISLKEHVLSPIPPPRDRLSIAVSLIQDPDEAFGCAPVGLDAFSFYSNIYAAGVFSTLCIAVFYSEFSYLFEDAGWTVYKLSNCPNVLNPEKRVIPTVRFQTGREAIAYMKKNFGNDSELYKAHEEKALMARQRLLHAIDVHTSYK